MSAFKETKAGEMKMTITRRQKAINLRRLAFLMLLVSFLAYLTGCGEPARPARPYVAMVNGDKIYLDVFEEELKKKMAFSKSLFPLSETEFESIQEAILQALILEKLILKRAEELLVFVGDEELNKAIEELKKDYQEGEEKKILTQWEDHVWREELRKRLIKEKIINREVGEKITITEAEAQEYYNKNKQSYNAEKSVRALQIVVRERTRAQRIRKRLQAGEDFGQVAREVSISPEASRGGDLGSLEAGIMPVVFDRVAFALPIGKISPVVKSPYGYHIIKVLEKDAGGPRTYSQVKERVHADLRKEKQDQAYAHWIEGLKAKAIITIK